VIRVLVADDEALARDGLAALIGAAADIEVVATVADGQQALDAARIHNPDVVVMDVRMPVLDGIAATARLAEELGEAGPRVMVLTTFDLDEYVYDALAAGASGFLLKDAGGAEFVRAVRLVAAGDALLAPSVTRRLIAEFTQRRRPAPAAATRMEGLTNRERQVLALVAGGLSNAEVAAELVVTEETVKTHVSRVLAKLGLRDRAQAIVAAYNAGLVVADRR